MGFWAFTDKNLILASQSFARKALLNQAGLSFQTEPAFIDEEMIRGAAQAEEATPDEIAILLAEMKGEKCAANHPDDMIISSDQLLVCEGQIYGKPTSLEMAKSQLLSLSGKRHQLITTALLFDKENVFGIILRALRLPFTNLMKSWLMIISIILGMRR